MNLLHPPSADFRLPRRCGAIGTEATRLTEFYTDHHLPVYRHRFIYAPLLSEHQLVPLDNLHDAYTSPRSSLSDFFSDHLHYSVQNPISTSLSFHSFRLPINVPDIQVSVDVGLPAHPSSGRYPLHVFDKWTFGEHTGQLYFVVLVSLAPVPYGDLAIVPQSLVRKVTG